VRSWCTGAVILPESAGAARGPGAAPKAAGNSAGRLAELDGRDAGIGHLRGRTAAAGACAAGTAADFAG
jgi:hypothetical protein